MEEFPEVQLRGVMQLGPGPYSAALGKTFLGSLNLQGRQQSNLEIIHQHQKLSCDSLMITESIVSCMIMLSFYYF